MNKKDLVNKIAADVEITKAAASTGLNAVIKSIQGGIVGDGGVQMVGFGTFQTVKRAARKGRNPQTGEDLILDARRVVTFNPSGILREKVNGS